MGRGCQPLPGVAQSKNFSFLRPRSQVIQLVDCPLLWGRCFMALSSPQDPNNLGMGAPEMCKLRLEVARKGALSTAAESGNVLGEITIL